LVQKRDKTAKEERIKIKEAGISPFLMVSTL